MTAPFRVASVTFNSGDAIDTREADIVVLVGPNNSGKSRCLVEMVQRLSLVPGMPQPVNWAFVNAGVELDERTDAGTLHEWIRHNRYRWVEPGDGRERIKSLAAGDLLDDQVEMYWQQAGPGLGTLAPHLVRGLWCGERLSYLGSPQRVDVNAHPDHPIQLLARNSDLMDEFRAAFRVAFGLNIIVDAWGNTIRLRVSPVLTQSDFVLESADGFPTKELVSKLSQLSTIEEQSDGVRSFAGVLLTLLATTYPLVLLDEPEAFLHPPQARQLGAYLARLQKNGQLFVATHSLDILLGLIEGSPDRVLIARLTRTDGRTFAKTLDPVDLSYLWQDPLIKFSRALDGLFHDGVVVGEGDTDTSFYHAIWDLERNDTGSHVMFTYAGGKARIPLVTKALRALDVPVRVIVDFDALNDATTLRSLVEGMGAEYSEAIEADRKLLDAHLRGSESKVTIGSAVAAITALAAHPSTEITRQMLGKAREALEPETGWRAAKKSGRSVVPNGDATVALDRLLAALADVGIFVVPTGAVESFVKAVPGKGPRWITDVIAGGHVATASEARDFVRGVMTSLGVANESDAVS